MRITTIAFAIAAALAFVASDVAAQSYYGPQGYGRGPAQGTPGYGPQGYRQRTPGYGYGRGYHRGRGPGKGGYGRGYDQADRTGPSAIVRGGINKLRAFVAKGSTQDPVQVVAFVKSEIGPAFDFEYMARAATGPRWQGLDGDARRALSDRLAEHFIGTLARHLGGYGKARVTIDRARRGQRQVTVPVTVYRGRRTPMQLSFKFYRAKDGWKVFDVDANGQSAVNFYRNHMGAGSASGRGYRR